MSGIRRGLELSAMRAPDSEHTPESTSRWQVIGAWVALVLALALQVLAIHAHSLTGDGAHHLLAGQRALTSGTNALNLEHPPLVKLVVALPTVLLDDELAPQALRPMGMLAAIEQVHRDAPRLHRATIVARYAMLVCFVLPLLGACFWLGRHVGGTRCGVLLTLLTALSFSTTANLTILQTDTAAALAYLLVAIAGLRLLERPGAPTALLLGLAVGFGIAVKHSGLLLGASAAVALLAAHIGESTRRGLPRLFVRGLLLAGAALVVVELSYGLANLDYDPVLGRQAIRDYTRGGAMLVADRLHGVEAALLALERWDPRLAQWATGVLGVRAQNTLGVYPGYAFGEIRYTGRLWYFPALLAVKTPLVLLALLAPAYIAVTRRLHGSPKLRCACVLAAPALFHFGMAMFSNYNLGFRHLIPIVPFLYLPIAWWLADRRRLAPVVVVVLVLECIMLTPRWMSTTNTWWLGEHNPMLLAFGAGNLEYGQGLASLGRWAERNDVPPLRVLFPRLGPLRLEAHVPGAMLLEPDDELPPGWYAVSLKVEQLLPAALAQPELGALHALARRWQPTYETIQAGENHGLVAGTFRIRRLSE